VKTDGWIKVNQEGSHEQYKHASKPRRVTIAGKDGDDVSPYILNGILRQAKIPK
jgi:predicted RNA binding protein YcfA (HicA-like mRNA interferase family)